MKVCFHIFLPSALIKLSGQLQEQDKVLMVTDYKIKQAMIRIGFWTETCEMFCLTSTALVV